MSLADLGKKATDRRDDRLGLILVWRVARAVEHQPRRGPLSRLGNRIDLGERSVGVVGALNEQRRHREPGRLGHERPGEDFPQGPNREDTFYFCTACHGFKLVAAQGMSRERWDESFTWMVERHKMPKPEGQERERMLDYLAAAFPERRQPGGWKNPFAPQ